MNTEFRPDYATPPGESLTEALNQLGMSQTELARRMGRPVKTVNEIIQAKAAITSDTALELEKVLGTSASFWSNLETRYRDFLARQRAATKLTVDEDWLGEVPVREMQDRGWLPKGLTKEQLMDAILRFFGVAGVSEWKATWEDPLVSFRKSPAFKGKSAAIATWVRRGEIEGRKQECKPFDSAKFRHALDGLRAATLLEPKQWIPEITKACNACGVAYVFVPEFANCHVSGATRWLKDDCALILQSGRHKDDGHFWFTFFHEARHVLQNKQKKVWTIETDEQSSDPLEIDADTFAAEFLIPSRRIMQFRRENGGKMPVEAAKALASELGIAPGIVAGHFHHEKFWKPMVGHQLKKRFSVHPVRGIE